MDWKNLYVVFPLAVALFALFWFVRWAGLHRRELPEPAPDSTESKRQKTARAPFFTRRDWLVMAAITVVYAIVAFAGLGDRQAPQSFLHFTAGNQYALVDLGEPRQISALRYYTGLVAEDYRLEVSLDGENWTEMTDGEGNSAMPQEYSSLFRWVDASWDYDRPVRYIRIISGAEQYLGEIALYGADGSMLRTDEFSVAPGCEQLVDEQSTVTKRTYKSGTYFDEIYFPRTALEMILKIWPYEITHPPLGKAILSIGIRLFGMTPFGWRFMGTLFGVLMLPPLYVFLKRMFADTVAAGAGTTVFAFDFMHYTQTRLATIDGYSVFFIICMYLFLYLWMTDKDDRSKKRIVWLALAGLSFGLGAATKWICLYAGAGLGILWAVYWIERRIREKDDMIVPLCENVLWCLLFFVVIPAVIYSLSYLSYAQSLGETSLRGYIKIVLDNQRYMWDYHSDLVATHPYSSKWYQWLLDTRPILYYLEYLENDMKSAFGAFSNPLLCWGGLLAMGGMVWIAIRDRDNRAMFIVIGYLANLLPWVLVSRLTFAYHYFPCTVFLLLAVAWIFADLRKRDPRWKASIGSFTVICVVLFVVFYPTLSGAPVSSTYARHFLHWFNTWPF